LDDEIYVSIYHEEETIQKLKMDISKIKNNEYMNEYFLKTGHLLYEYYDGQKADEEPAEEEVVVEKEQDDDGDGGDGGDGGEEGEEGEEGGDEEEDGDEEGRGHKRKRKQLKSSIDEKSLSISFIS
jgi:hypothetical protein